MPPSKWPEIYNLILNDIRSGVYKPGQSLPPQEDLAVAYNVSRATVQKAFAKLTQDGKILTLFEHFDRRRIVMPEIVPSTRTAGFRNDNADNHTAFVESLELHTIDDPPTQVKELLGNVVLRHLTRQWKNHIPVAISESYVSSILPLDKLKEHLTKGDKLYDSMRLLGFYPSNCEESLHAKMATEDDMKYLYGPKIVIVEIVRKVFDDDGNLLELCFLKDRADSYIFNYRFNL